MYQVKVKYDKMQDNGCVKPVTDTYIVDALSFTEAEARTVEYVQPYISGEFTVTDIKRVKVAELWEAPAGGDYWFEAQLEFITIDEKTASEKRTKNRVLVQADNLQQAMQAVADNMKDSMADYEAASLKKTPIVEYIKITPNDTSEND
jgi:hypothetical protein